MGCKEGRTLLSITKFGFFVKMRLIQDDEFGRRCTGLDINWRNPDDIVNDSSWVPSWDVISSDHHDLDIALKLKFRRKSSKSLTDWLGEQKITANITYAFLES